jgi:hypothetical protein
MLRLIPILAIALLSMAHARASTIDFESQAAGRGGALTGIPDSPLVIGIATFTGGELRHAEISLPADQTGVYATEGLFGSDGNPLIITFSMPVTSLSLLVLNGEAANQTYTLFNNLGDSVHAQLALPGSLQNSAATLSLSGRGITAVSVQSANNDFWNFAIDNVTFTPVPEESTCLLLAGGAGFLACASRRRRSNHCVRGESQ